METCATSVRHTSYGNNKIFSDQFLMATSVRHAVFLMVLINNRFIFDQYLMKIGEFNVGHR